MQKPGSIIMYYFGNEAFTLKMRMEVCFTTRRRNLKMHQPPVVLDLCRDYDHDYCNRFVCRGIGYGFEVLNP